MFRDPRKRIEHLIIVSLIFIVYLYLYVYQDVLQLSIPFISVSTLITLPVITIIVFPLVKQIIIKSDPLQRSPSNNKTIRFFQNEFPSNYILSRCQECIEDENTCANYIKPDSFAHIRYWFRDLFHGIIEQEDQNIVNETFEKGYNCKLNFYMSWILRLFLIISIITLGVEFLLHNLFNFNTLGLNTWKIIFPVVCLIILIMNRFINQPNHNKPNGCWQAWRQINGIHRSWLESNEGKLVELICRANDNNKKYQKKIE